MTQNQIITRLISIQKGIEGDNFTWENIEQLIRNIKSLRFTQPEVAKELLRISNQVESDRFTRENLLSLTADVNKKSNSTIN